MKNSKVGIVYIAQNRKYTLKDMQINIEFYLLKKEYKRVNILYKKLSLSKLNMMVDMGLCRIKVLEIGVLILGLEMFGIGMMYGICCRCLKLICNPLFCSYYNYQPNYQ